MQGIVEIPRRTFGEYCPGRPSRGRWEWQGRSKELGEVDGTKVRRSDAERESGRGCDISRALYLY